MSASLQPYRHNEKSHHGISRLYLCLVCRVMSTGSATFDFSQLLRLFEQGHIKVSTPFIAGAGSKYYEMTQISFLRKMGPRK